MTKPRSFFVIATIALGVLIGLLVISKGKSQMDNQSNLTKMATGNLPRLKTSGSQILRADTNKPIRLRGVNVCSLEFDNSGANYGLVKGDSALFTILSDPAKWSANVIRMPLNQEWLNSNTNGYQKRVEELIDDAQRKGLYVILVDQWEKGMPTNPYSLNILKSPTFGEGNTTEEFWRSVLRLWKHKTNLLYDIINEPHDYPKNIAARETQRLITIMTEIQPDAVFVVSEPDWANELTYYPTNHINGASIIYSVHEYAKQNPTTKFDINFGNAAKEVPLIIGEFDTEGTNSSYQKALINYAESHGVDGWMAWAIGCGMQATYYDFSNNTPAGYIAKRLRELNVQNNN